MAYGSDPEQVVDLLLAIAQDDPDVLRNPLPSALLEELGELGAQVSSSTPSSPIPAWSAA